MTDHVTRIEFEQHKVELAQRKLQVDAHLIRLDGLVERLHRDHGKTAERVDALAKKIEEMPEQVQERLDDQTDRILGRVDANQEALLSFVTDKLVETARQWPASSIVAVTAVLALVVGLLVLGIARALGWG